MVSIIIICEEWNNFLEESLPHYENMDYDNYEIYVFSTKKINKKYPKVKFINELKLKNKPAGKRDMAIKYAKGEIFAFIDDDAFPSEVWLKNACKFFSDPKITAVAGPGVTPESSSVFEKASGWISASQLGGFGVSHRFIPQKERLVDDHPSMNLLVRASDFKKVGGFDSNFYPGEDTKLCLDLTSKLKKEIVYSPKVLVYHHKRPLFIKHLVQNGRYGMHRGHFAKILPKTSKKWFYFVPSFFSLGLLGGLLFTTINYTITPQNAIVNTLLSIFYIIILTYTVLLIANSIWILKKSKNVIVAVLSIPGTFATHFWYGLRFVQGYFEKGMEDTYGRS